MITIEQLLESVDLYFEPRWITKDENGLITFHSYETEPIKLDGFWGVKDDFYEFDKRLRLAEFENKPWQECIYEVPRKTTGKIEKVEGYTTDKILAKVNEIIDWINKVDAVNELKGAKNE